MSDPRRSPLRDCCSCLYRIGFGIQRIAPIVRKQKGVVFKWIKSAGILDSERAANARLRQTNRARRKPIKISKRAKLMIMEEYFTETKILKRYDSFWKFHPAVKACYHDLFKINWKLKNRSKVKQYAKNWKLKNPEKVRELRRKCDKKRSQNPQYRMRHNLRSRIRDFMKRGAFKQSATQLLGCGRAQLMSWMESKFLHGMNWNNYGKWHVDHILPCASFDLTKPDQQKICFHYTNLQPLWEKDNLDKSDTMPPVHQPELCMSL